MLQMTASNNLKNDNGYVEGYTPIHLSLSWMYKIQILHQGVQLFSWENATGLHMTIKLYSLSKI